MGRRSAALLALALGAAVPATATPVRLFAVGHEVRVDDAVTYHAFRDRMGALMDAAFPGRAGLVQPGVDDVAGHLAPLDPAAPPAALVLFPEDAGLVTAFTGTRGAGARAQASSAVAILGLFGPYDPQVQHYAAKYPGQPLVRNLVLALTDTFYRAFYETFRDLAVRHGVWIAAGLNAAPARRVDAAEDAGLVAVLRDPDEPGRTWAYEAVSPWPVNTTFLFAPDGSLVVPDGAGGTLRAPAETGGVLRGAADKTYLTPIEQPPPGNAAGLSLRASPVRDLDVLDTPVGRLGIVISKDAWMVDVQDRLVAKGANLILQPEAFDSWAFTDAEWSPDVFKEGGFANLQKNPEWVANVDASMTGNLLDITFDGQSAILGRRRKVDPGPLSPANAWVGQNPDTGFLAIAPWIAPDPGIADPALTLAERRAQLAALGTALRPGSGVPCGGPLVVGPCEGGYREAIVWADVELPDGAVTAPLDPVRETPPRFAASVRVSGPETVPAVQQAPRVAARGPRVAVVWHEAAAGALPNVRLALSRDGGASFGTPIRVSDNAPGTVAESHAALAMRGRRIAVVWQEYDAERDDDAGRIQLAWFDLSGSKRGGDVRVDDRDGVGKWLPAVAFSGSRPVVAWIDERDAGLEGEAFEHVYAARATADRRGFGPAVRVDAGAPVALATHHDNKWAPAVAAAGRDVYVAWSDFRNYSWDVFLAASHDHGATFGANVRVDDFPGFERIHERPAVAATRAGLVHVAWTDLRAREPDTNVFAARSHDHGATFDANRQIDGSRAGFDPDADTPTNQWHPALVAERERVYAAWQDDRLGNADVFFAASGDGGATFAAAERVDDTGAGTSAQTRPHMAIAGNGARRRCLVVWEDDRDGTRDVRLARRPCPR